MRTIQISELVEFIRGVSFKPGDLLSPGDDKAVACMRTKNVQIDLDLSDIWWLPERFVKRKDQLLKPGDILVSTANSWNLVGKCCWVPELPWPTTLGGFISAIRPISDMIDKRYFYWWFASEAIQAEIRGCARQTTNIANLSQEQCLALRIPSPPLDEQRRIAAILDQADDLRRRRREALGRLQRLVPSIFLEMFGDIRENQRNWPVACLGDAGKLDRGVSRHRPRNDPILLGGLHPLIQTGDIANCDGYIRNFNSTYSDEGLRQSKKWPAGTLCITIAANIGKTGILSFDACFPDSVVGFTPGKQVKTEFIQEWLRFLQPELEKDAPQFAQKNINLETLRSLSLFIPPLALQEAFAARVAEIDKLKAHHRAHLARLDALFASLQHRAFRGDLPSPSFSRAREKVASRSEVG